MLSDYDETAYDNFRCQTFLTITHKFATNFCVLATMIEL